jgi:hypothetical protein
MVARDLPGRKGPHVVDLTDDRVLAPGVYLVRLEQGKEARTARAVFVR